nr:MAG TPA: hypothetical protein [Caudoviricetes sp.]
MEHQKALPIYDGAYLLIYSLLFYFEFMATIGTTEDSSFLLCYELVRHTYKLIYF